jgi:hypothetical protein
MKFEEKINNVLTESVLETGLESSEVLIKNNAKRQPGELVLDMQGNPVETLKIVYVDKYRLTALSKGGNSTFKYELKQWYFAYDKPESIALQPKDIKIISNIKF